MSEQADIEAALARATAAYKNVKAERDALKDAADRAEAAEAENERLREAGDKLFWSAKEFVDDWKKGDFSLPTLAAADAQSLDDALARYSSFRAALAKEAG